MKLADLVRVLDDIAPPHFAFGFDHIGLQCGSLESDIKTAAVTLDHSLFAVQFCQNQGCDLLVVHHPLIWDPITELTPENPTVLPAYELAKSGIACFATHTNWDCAQGGVNDALCSQLGLINCIPFGPSQPELLTLLQTYVPNGHEETLINKLKSQGFSTHCGYQDCVYQSAGLGRYLPTSEAKPFLGEVGQYASTPEVKLEWLMPNRLVSRAKAMLQEAHPYEVPLFIEAQAGSRPAAHIGRVGHLTAPMTLKDFKTHVDNKLDTSALVWGDPARLISKVALIGGSSGSDWRSAIEEGVDIFVTGEIPQNEAVDAVSAGFSVMAAGHYATEQPGMAAMKNLLDHRVPEISWKLIEPPPGFGGRPL